MVLTAGISLFPIQKQVIYHLFLVLPKTGRREEVRRELRSEVSARWPHPLSCSGFLGGAQSHSALRPVVRSSGYQWSWFAMVQCATQFRITLIIIIPNAWVLNKCLCVHKEGAVQARLCIYFLSHLILSRLVSVLPRCSCKPHPLAVVCVRTRPRRPLPAAAGTAAARSTRTR